MTERMLTVYDADGGDAPFVIECHECGKELWKGRNGGSFTAEQLLTNGCDCTRPLKTLREVLDQFKGGK